LTIMPGIGLTVFSGRGLDSHHLHSTVACLTCLISCLILGDFQTISKMADFLNPLMSNSLGAVFLRRDAHPPPPLSRVAQPVSKRIRPVGHHQRALLVSYTYIGICDYWRESRRPNRVTRWWPAEAPKISNWAKSLETT